MLRNYFKIAFRNLKRFKAYTLINLLGLALGLTVGVLILLFVTDELSYDQFHAHKDRIFKIATKNVKGGTMETNAWPVGLKLQELPEVEKVLYAKKSSMMVKYEGHRYEHEIFYASPEFFDIFSFEMVEGDPHKALVAPYSMVITESMKKRYFGNDLVLGKTLTLQDSIDFNITGVIKDVPNQSHIQFDMLLSFATWIKMGDIHLNGGWGNFNVKNYVMLKENTNAAAFAHKAAGIYMDKDFAGDKFRELGMEFEVKCIPLSDVYLKSDVSNGFGSKGSLERVYLVSGIAIFVILLACINFINLTTARSIYRAKEVGLRKIVGSTRGALLRQFLSESFILTLLSFVLAALFVDLLLPFFNHLISKQYDLLALFNGQIVLGAIVLIAFVTLFSGFYPAWVLSSYRPVEVLKGRMQTSSRGVRLRRFLVIFQFFISGGLVVATLLVLQQLDYMRNTDLGFDKEQILVLDATRVPRSASHAALKNGLQSLATVENVSFTNALPGRPGWLGQWAYPEKQEDSQQVDTEYMAVDENYISTLGLELVAGNNFDLKSPSQLNDGVIINETTVKEMGWQTPEKALGHHIVSPSGYPEGTVIGVVKDFHGLGLQENIWPQVMDYQSEKFGRYYAIRFTTGSTASLVREANELWEKYMGDYTYEYFFLDEDFDKQYKSEEQLMTVFIVFASITVIIAVIGLLGLVSFVVLARTKEIGIRKVLGANVMGLASLLSREFTILVVLANLIVIPVVWYFGNQWLDNFAYRMEINPMVFIMSLAIMLAIAVITVSVQTIKAAMTNPVDVLKNE